MNKIVIFSVALIILGGGVAYGQDDSIPKHFRDDSSFSPVSEKDSAYDGYFLGQNYPNPF